MEEEEVIGCCLLLETILGDGQRGRDSGVYEEGPDAVGSSNWAERLGPVGGPSSATQTAELRGGTMARHWSARVHLSDSG